MLFIGNPKCLSIKKLLVDNKSELPVAFDFGHTDDKLQMLTHNPLNEVDPAGEHRQRWKQHHSGCFR